MDDARKALVLSLASEVGDDLVGLLAEIEIEAGVIAAAADEAQLILGVVVEPVFGDFGGVQLRLGHDGGNPNRGAG